MGLSDIDVARDIMVVSFISRSEDESAKKEFFLQITEWTP